MPGRAVPDTQALTRRQIRDAERARERATLADLEPRGATRRTSEPTAPAARVGEAAAPKARTAAPTPPQTRRQIRAAEHALAHPDVVSPESLHTSVPPSRRSLRSAPLPNATTEVLPAMVGPGTVCPTRLRSTTAATARKQPALQGSARWVPRSAVLVGLAALTIAAPLTGVATADSAGVAVASVPVAAVPAENSMLARLDTLAAATTPNTGAPPARLLADPNAEARAAALQASRATDRAALETTAKDGANGTRAAVEEPQASVVMPLAAGTYRLTSGYGYRNDPLGRGRSFHTGTDMAAPLGAPIYAVADGIVDYVGVGKDGRSSMLIVLKHEIDGRYVYSWYNHMYPDGLYVQEGQEVQSGEVIAAVGSNGNSTGPHLHLEIHTDDKLTTTEPLAWLAKQGAVDVNDL